MQSYTEQMYAVYGKIISVSAHFWQIADSRLLLGKEELAGADSCVLNQRLDIRRHFTVGGVGLPLVTPTPLLQLYNTSLIVQLQNSFEHSAVRKVIRATVANRIVVT